MIVFALLGCQSKGPPNVLLVSIDTVRADRLSVYGAVNDTTPNLERLAEAGVVFEHAFSQSNESAYSHATLFTGAYPSEVAAPVYETYALPESATLAPEVLKLYGYQTAAFVAGGHISEGFGFNQGYDHFQSKFGFASFWDTAPDALDWMRAAGDENPWFVFLHSYDAHRPYTKPGPWNHLYSDGAGSPLSEKLVANANLSELVAEGQFLPSLEPTYFAHPSGDYILSPSTYTEGKARVDDTSAITVTDADKEHVRDHYDASIAYADLALGAFLAKAEDADLLDNTVIIVLSDHGEDLLDHGYMNHRTALTDSCTRVPTIIAGPGFPEGLRVEGLVDALDITPTILALAGATPPASLRGRDLRAVVAGDVPALNAVFSEGVMDMISVRTATHRLVYHHASLAHRAYARILASAQLTPDHFTLYDLVADPGERTDVLAKNLTKARELRGLLLEWRRSIALGAHVLPQDQVDPAVADQLRKHGYWDAAPPKPTTR